LRIYSNNGYGGEILVGTGINPEDGIRSINDEEMDAVLKAIAKQESSHPLASAVLVVNANKNDHHLENVEQFDINLSDFFDAKGSCFGGYVRRPNFWNTWTKEFITDIPDQEVWFWFFGRPNPEGPFHEWNMPQFFYPPMISLRDPYEEFRMRGTKGAVIRYTRTS
jgi:hypothetical protein